MKMKFCLIQSAVAAILLGLIAGGSQADVIVTEIMYNADGSDDGREWVEIYNNGGVAVDISGWDLKDEDDPGLAGPIPNSTSLAPGEALVLIEDQTIFESDWGTGINFIVLPGMGTSLNLANSPASGNEVLMLRDGSDSVIDTVDYDDGSPWPLDAPDETSIYLLPGKLTAIDNDDGANWGGSVPGVHGAYQANGRIEGGSPGVVVIPEPSSLAVLWTAALIAGALRRRAA